MFHLHIHHSMREFTRHTYTTCHGIGLLIEEHAYIVASHSLIWRLVCRIGIYSFFIPVIEAVTKNILGLHLALKPHLLYRRVSVHRKNSVRDLVTEFFIDDCDIMLCE